MLRTVALTTALVSFSTAAWGAEWRRDPGATPAPGSATDVARAALTRGRAAWDLGSVDLVPLRELATGATRTVRFEQRYQGLPVFGRDAAIRVDGHGRVSVLVLEVERGLQVDVVPVVPESAAVEIARRASPRAPHHAAGERVVLGISPDGAASSLVWRVDVQSPTGGHRVVVDARSGMVRSVRALAVDVLGRVYPVSSVTTPETADVELTELDVVAPQKLTGWAGNLTVTNYVSGDTSNDPFVLEQALVANVGADFLYDPPVDLTDPDDGFAQVGIYYHLTRMRGFVENVLGVDTSAPGWKLIAVANVHDGPNPLDNAFFSPGGIGAPWGAPNLIGIGQGTAFDYAQDSDVFNHEFTHYLTSNAIGYNAGTNHVDEYGRSPFSAAIDEGLSDYFACTVNGDGFLGEASLALHGAGRDLTDTSKRCPNEMNGEPHADGEIIGSYAWTVRTILGAEVGDQMVWGAAALLPFGASFGDFGRGILQTADEMVTAGTVTSSQRTQLEIELEARGLHACDPEIPLVEGDPRAETLNGYSNCQEARAEGRTRQTMFHYVVTPGADAAGIEVEVTMEGDPSSLLWGIYGREGEHVSFVPQFPVEVDEYDFATEGLMSNEGELVIDAESDPPFEPGATYHFVILHTNCSDSYAILSTKDLGPPVPGAGGAGGAGGGGAGVVPDGAAPAESDEGCGCHAVGRTSRSSWLGLVAVAVGALAAGRRRRRGRVATVAA